MKKAVISQTVNLLDGGCNVCGIVEDVNYSLTFEEEIIPLEELTVHALITAMTNKKGYKHEYRMDEVEDYIIYTKNNQIITVKEEYNKLTYIYGEHNYSTANQIADKVKLAETVHYLLAVFFHIEDVAIAIDL